MLDTKKKNLYILSAVIIVASFLPFVSNALISFDGAILGIKLGYYGFLIPLIEVIVCITFALDKKSLSKIFSLIEFLFILLLFVVTLYALVVRGHYVLSIGSYILLLGSFIQLIASFKK